MKVLITESIAQEGVDELRESGYEVDYLAGIKREDILRIIGSYDALIVRSTTKVNEELLELASALKVVGRAGNGTDNIDIPLCTKRGIVVVNTPEGNSMAAAELAITHAFNCFRNFSAAVLAGKNNDFRRGSFIGRELEGKTVGIIGLGRIGSIVARKLQGCGMKAIAYDPYILDERFVKLGVRKCVTLDELLSEADLITIHTPKTQETVGIIGAAEIAKCKDGVRIVNAARGGLVDEKALYDALVSGKVAFAGIDVLSPEPNYNRTPEEQDYHNPLLTLDNIAVTPHLGASTREATVNCGISVCTYVGAALRGEMVPAVNMPHGDMESMDRIRPYLTLAEALGSIYFQMNKDRVRNIIITYSGDIASEDTDIITTSIIKGFLTPACDETVNYINANLILESMKVDVTEKKTPRDDRFSNRISVSFVTDEKNFTVSGTVFDRNEIRIIDFLGYRMDFAPKGYVIAFSNEDVPGVIGKVGTLLGEFGLNISAMQNSSNKNRGLAETFVGVDEPVTREVRDAILALPEVRRAAFLHFG